MSLHRRIGVVVISVAFLLAGGLWGHAQAPLPPPAQAQAPTIISGSDLGFRVDGRKGNTPLGTLVVRINGQWVEAEFGAGVKRLTAR
jgi:hypothetical protein